jgi:hypothetical protein
MLYIIISYIIILSYDLRGPVRGDRGGRQRDSGRQVVYTILCCIISFHTYYIIHTYMYILYHTCYIILYMCILTILCYAGRQIVSITSRQITFKFYHTYQAILLLRIISYCYITLLTCVILHHDVYYNFNVWTDRHISTAAASSSEFRYST